MITLHIMLKCSYFRSFHQHHLPLQSCYISVGMQVELFFCSFYQILENIFTSRSFCYYFLYWKLESWTLLPLIFYGFPLMKKACPRIHFGCYKALKWSYGHFNISIESFFGNEKTLYDHKQDYIINFISEITLWTFWPYFEWFWAWFLEECYLKLYIETPWKPMAYCFYLQNSSMS